MKTTLFDFEDSFTLNIYSELKELGLHCEVVPRAQANDRLSKLCSSADFKDREAIILGPGPGHPDEYQDVQKYIPALMDKKNIFLMGICLGHQLIGQSLGLKARRSKKPCHGEVESLVLGNAEKELFGMDLPNINVQRYNSLCLSLREFKGLGLGKSIKAIGREDEVQLMRSERLISYQFHPESVGTSFRKGFFLPLQTFLL